MSIQISYVSQKTAEYAVLNWHYSKRMPKGKLIRYGVKEDGKYIGVVLYGSGANNNMLKPYALECNEGCELVRVALRSHVVNVTEIIAITLRLLKKDFEGLRLVVSYADERQGHKGKIYQAGNWYYTGKIKSTPEYWYNNKWNHQRVAIRGFGGMENIRKLEIKTRDGGYRFRYLYPLDNEMRKVCEGLKKSYADIV